MSKLAHHITVEAFVKHGDALAAAEKAFDRLVPVPIMEVRAVQWSWHPDRERTKVYALPKKGVTLLDAETPGDGGPMRVLQYRFTKQRDTAAFLERLRSELDAEALLRNLDDSFEDGKLCLRLNQKALELGALSLSRGPSVFVRINLAAFPKNEETCRRVALQALGQAPEE